MAVLVVGAAALGVDGGEFLCRDRRVAELVLRLAAEAVSDGAISECISAAVPASPACGEVVLPNGCRLGVTLRHCGRSAAYWMNGHVEFFVSKRAFLFLGRHRTDAHASRVCVVIEASGRRGNHLRVVGILRLPTPRGLGAACVSPHRRISTTARLPPPRWQSLHRVGPQSNVVRLLQTTHPE